ncbi:MAG: ABC transporter ATP-binding protein [Eubacteriales bacterium]|nr:ABC transporter ATP-binding protein [Eubacteriales bacterium]
MMDCVLTLKNVNVTYVNKEKRVMAVRNASLSVNKGDSLGLVGESGSGKSTLAMAVLGLLPQETTQITGEAIFLGDKDLFKLNESEFNELRWTKLAVVFQKAMNSLSPVHRISKQIEDIYRVHFPSASKEKIREVTVRLLKLVNLPERVYRLYPHEMSGGMLQRVAIVISLLHAPQLLIFDEATTALDVVTQGQILEEIVQMEKTLETTRVMITHDMSVVATSCNKIAVMYAGEIMETGLVVNVMRHPQHPYTQALLTSFPSLKGETRKMISIPGFLPDLSKEHPACVFAPRCGCAGERCRREKPLLKENGDGGQVACFLYDGGVA